MSDSLELIADGTPVTAARPIHRCRTAGLREIATSRRAKIESRSPLRYCYTLRDAVWETQSPEKIYYVFLPGCVRRIVEYACPTCYTSVTKEQT